MSDHERPLDSQKIDPDAAYLISRPLSQEDSETLARNIEDSRFKQNQIKTNNRLVFLNFCLVLGTAISFAIGIFQIRFARKAIEQADRNSVESSRQFQVQLHHYDDGLGRIGLLALHAGEQAGAAKTSSDTAVKTLKAQQKTFEINQRPYVIPSNLSFTAGHEPHPDEPITATLAIVNVGKTPAEKFTGWGQLFLYGGNEQQAGRTHIKPFIDSKFKEVGDKVANAQQEAIMFGFESDVAPGEPWFVTSPKELVIPKNVFGAVENGDWIIYYLGIIKYSDSFKHSYETQVCYYYSGVSPHNWHICDDHNRIE